MKWLTNISGHDTPYSQFKDAWFKVNCCVRLRPSFEFVQTVDNDMALKIHIKARATPKVVAAFAERREFDKILIYSKQVWTVYIPKSEMVKF